jgi:putative phosphoesterase
MKIALIGDVHANLSALNAVLEDARKQHAEAVWNLGDFVGYAAHPDQVVRLMRTARAISILGNYDRAALDAGRDSSSGLITEKALGYVWAFENLSSVSRRFLAALPPERHLRLAGHRVLLVHGSPASDKERLLPTTSRERIRALSRLARADLVLCGHSHVPFVRGVDGTTFVNPGSVGRSNDGDPRASYALVNLHSEGVEVIHRRVAFDLKPEVAAIRDRGLPETYAQMLLLGTGYEKAHAEVARLIRRGPQTTREHLLRLEKSLSLAVACRYEVGHAHQVTWLALRLFDELRGVHKLGDTERRWLLYAGILHDIGWLEGRKDHHKASLRRILEARDLPFTLRERRIVGCVARYHRRAVPDDRHRVYSNLRGRDRGIVKVLSAILRVADGLDRTHKNIVEEINASVTPNELLVTCTVRGPARAERTMALRKGNLLEEVFGRRLVVQCRHW